MNGAYRKQHAVRGASQLPGNPRPTARIEGTAYASCIHTPAISRHPANLDSVAGRGSLSLSTQPCGGGRSTCLPTRTCERVPARRRTVRHDGVGGCWRTAADFIGRDQLGARDGGAVSGGERALGQAQRRAWRGGRWRPLPAVRRATKPRRGALRRHGVDRRSPRHAALRAAHPPRVCSKPIHSGRRRRGPVVAPRFDLSASDCSGAGGARVEVARADSLGAR